jgi:hypothetical protein
MLASGERRVPVEQILRQLCMPPYGANIASAGLLLGVFVAPRVEKIMIARGGQQLAVSLWLQDGIFRNKFMDIGALRDTDIVPLGDESSEWDILLDEWEQAESHFARTRCLERAEDLKERVPIPPPLWYRFNHLKQNSGNSLRALIEVQKEEGQARTYIVRGEEHGDVAELSRGAAVLAQLEKKLSSEGTLWTQHETEGLRPDIDRVRQLIVQVFSEWLARQSLTSDSPDAVGDFKHRMVRLIGTNLQKLNLSAEYDSLVSHVNGLVKNAETFAEAHQLVRDVRSWLQQHADVCRIVRVNEIRGLCEVGKSFASKLQGMSLRIKSSDIGEVRTELSEALGKMKGAEESIVRRLSRLLQSTLRSEEELAERIEEVEALTGAFENCQSDLEDLRMMRHALRLYQRAFTQLADDKLTWKEFAELIERLIQETEGSIGEAEIWSPKETITGFGDAVAKRRKVASAAWVESVESEAATVMAMSVTDANRLYTRVSAPPAVLTDLHTKRLNKTLKSIETRLDTLKIEWLIEKFKELSPALRKKFLELVSGKEHI